MNALSREDYTEVIASLSKAGFKQDKEFVPRHEAGLLLKEKHLLPLWSKFFPSKVVFFCQEFLNSSDVNSVFEGWCFFKMGNKNVQSISRTS